MSVPTTSRGVSATALSSVHCEVVTKTLLALEVLLCAYCPVSTSHQPDFVSFVNAGSSVGSSTEMVLLKGV